MASVKNLASGTLVSGINVGDTTLTVAVGSGTSEELLAVWPTPPFYITVAPDSPASGVSNILDSEIMSVTAISHSSGNIIMTVTRAQRGTTAKAFNANAIVTNAIYADDAVLLGPNGTTESPSPWIQSGDIIDGAITPAKFASGAVNSATKTSNNLAPTDDTPTAWSTLLGGDGYYWTYYSSNSFTNQPSQYGFLETIITGAQIYQRWKGHVDGMCYYRGGNGDGWEGSSSDSGVFRTILDSKTSFTDRLSTGIPANADLNTLTYCQPGIYSVTLSATAASLSNCPTSSAFRMEVYCMLTNDTVITSDKTYRYLIRKITDIEGREFVQKINSNGVPNWTYGAWRKITSNVPDYDTAVTPATNFNISDYNATQRLKLTVYGKTVYLQGRIATTAAIPEAYTPICSFPAEYVPASGVNLAGTTSASQFVRFDVSVNTTTNLGYLYSVSKAWTNGESMRATFTWRLD